jgi:hypothetical protein
MQVRPSLRRSVPLVAAVLLGLAMGPIPGKWVLSDGAKLVRKPPAGSGLDLAVVLNSGPDEVLLTSNGTLLTQSLVVAPDGVAVSFVLPEGGKNVVLRDTDVDGQGCKGSLVWAKWKNPLPPGGGGGNE